MRMPFQIDLIGKVVLITGVSSGIGLGTAHEFARAGACVAGCARKPESDDSVSAFLQAVEGEGCKALYVQADVTQEEELEKLVQEVIATFGRLDIVVSNAGMNVFEGAAECSESRWAYNLDLNLASHWRFGPGLPNLIWTKRQWGYLIDDFQSCFLLHSGMFPL